MSCLILVEFTLIFKITEDVRILVKTIGSKYQLNGYQYLKFDSVKLNIRPKKYRLEYGEIFNGQKTLEEVAKVAVKQNEPNVIRESILKVSQVMEIKILKLANQFLAKATFDEFFP